MLEVLIVSAPFLFGGAFLALPALAAYILGDEELKKTFRF